MKPCDWCGLPSVVMVNDRTACDAHVGLAFDLVVAELAAAVGDRLPPAMADLAAEVAAEVSAYWRASPSNGQGVNGSSITDDG